MTTTETGRATPTGRAERQARRLDPARGLLLRRGHDTTVADAIAAGLSVPPDQGPIPKPIVG